MPRLVQTDNAEHGHSLVLEARTGSDGSEKNAGAAARGSA